MLPAEFLGGVGFKTQRAHPTTPRMRMELRSAISWKDEVESALEKVWGVVRPTQKATRPIGSVRRPHDARRSVRRALRRVAASRSEAQMKPSSSLRSAALGLAPTMDFTTSPSW